MSDPRREPESDPLAQLSRSDERIPPRVAVPDKEVAYFQYHDDCEKRRDLLFIELFLRLDANSTGLDVLAKNLANRFLALETNVKLIRSSQQDHGMAIATLKRELAESLTERRRSEASVIVELDSLSRRVTALELELRMGLGELNGTTSQTGKAGQEHNETRDAGGARYPTDPPTEQDP